MVPPSTTLNPAGTPSLAECASRFQCAVPSTCQMPFRSGLRSGVRGPLYAEGDWAAIPSVSNSRPAAAPTPALSERASTRVEGVAIGFFIPGSRESTSNACQPVLDHAAHFDAFDLTTHGIHHDQ